MFSGSVQLLFRQNSGAQYPSSFAGNAVNLDHQYDQTLHQLHANIIFPVGLENLNPRPLREQKAFSRLDVIDKMNMLQENYLLMSRIFIHNAKTVQLSQSFAQKPKLRILGVGSDVVANLFGVIAHLGQDREIEYVGIDKDEDNIKKCIQMFAPLQTQQHHFQFLLVDPVEFIRAGIYPNADLILMQVKKSRACAEYKDIFANIEKSLAEGGRLFCNIFYREQMECFSREYLPLLAKTEGVMCANHRKNEPEVAAVAGIPVVRYPEYYYYVTDPKRLVPQHRCGQ